MEEEYDGNIEVCVLTQSTSFRIQFEQNKCLENSYRVSMADNKFIMVEGIVITVENDNTFISACRHCWNKNTEDNTYFDVTKDYIWSQDRFDEELRNEGSNGIISYQYVKCIEYSVSDANIIDDTLGFKYSYTNNISVFNEEVLSRPTHQS